MRPIIYDVARQLRGETASTQAKLEAGLRKQARESRRLTEVEEAALLRQRPDPEAVEQLVQGNLDLVVELAEAHRDPGVSFADLYQEGAVGLVGAVAAYDGKGVFRDFAGLHVGLQMDSLVEAEAEARRKAKDSVGDAKILDTVQVMFRQRNGREASESEMAELLTWDSARLRRVLAILEEARERNDALTLDFLDDRDAPSDDQSIDWGEPETDPRRRPAGAGPDE